MTYILKSDPELGDVATVEISKDEVRCERDERGCNLPAYSLVLIVCALINHFVIISFDPVLAGGLFGLRA